MSVSGLSVSAVSALTPVATTTPSAAAAPNQSPPSSATDNQSGTSAFVSQLQQAATTLSDSSTASVQDKTNAWLTIFNAIDATGPDGNPQTSAWWTQTSQSQRQSIADVFGNSQYSNQSYSIKQQFNQAVTVANSKNSNQTPSTSNLNALNKFSYDQQLIIFARSGTGFDSLEAWKAQLTQQAQQEGGASSSNTTSAPPAVSVTLSDAAKAALVGSGTAAANTSDATSATVTSDPATAAATAAAQALKTLTSPSTTNSIADAALTILQNAASAQAAVKSDADKAAAADTISGTSPATTTQKSYTVGSKLDSTA